MRSRREVKKYVRRMLPDAAKARVGRVYNYIRARRADRRFEPVALSQNVVDGAPRHVVCVVVDALRTDVIDAETTPFLDSLAGVNAVTPAPWTFPAVSSIVTGQYPHEHEAVRQSDDPHSTTATGITLPPSMSADTHTLSELLAGIGYETYGAFGFDMPFLALSSRFSKHALYNYAPATTVLGDHCSWLASKRDDRTFSYIHLSDLHQPVSPPEQYARQFRVDTDLDDLSNWRYTDKTALEGDAAEYVEHRRRLYRAAVRYVNDSLSRYYRFLTDELGSDVILIVTGDHGEGFWEHAALDAEHFLDTRPAYCVGHGGTPYECISRVPLLVDGPSLEAFGSETTVSLIDIAPTILERVGLTGAVPTTGRSLQHELPSDRVVLSESTRYGYEKRALYYNGWKRIVSEGDDTALGFSLPEERPTPVPPATGRTMAGTLPPWPAADGTGAETTVSTTVERRLENLGYK